MLFEVCADVCVSLNAVFSQLFRHELVGGFGSRQRMPHALVESGQLKHRATIRFLNFTCASEASDRQVQMGGSSQQEKKRCELKHKLVSVEQLDCNRLEPNPKHSGECDARKLKRCQKAPTVNSYRPKAKSAFQHAFGDMFQYVEPFLGSFRESQGSLGLAP